MTREAMSACLKEQAGQQRSHPQRVLSQMISASAHGQTRPRTGMAKKPVPEEVLDNPVPVPIPHCWSSALRPRSLMLLWETAEKRESTSVAANPRLPTVCSWPIPCEDLCSWPIGCRHAAWLPLRGGGRLRGAEVGLAPFWVLEGQREESLPWPAVARLVCPPCFSQCWRRCKWSLAEVFLRCPTALCWSRLWAALRFKEEGGWLAGGYTEGGTRVWGKIPPPHTKVHGPPLQTPAQCLMLRCSYCWRRVKTAEQLLRSLQEAATSKSSV